MTIWAGGVDTTTWLSLWGAGVAVNGICVRSGRMGRQDGLGGRGVLGVSLGPAGG